MQPLSKQTRLWLLLPNASVLNAFTGLISGPSRLLNLSVTASSFFLALSTLSL